MSTPHIRPAAPADAARIRAIYNHYVTTTVSFEEAPVGAPEMAQRIADVGAAGLPWLVLELDGAVAGYAYAAAAGCCTAPCSTRSAHASAASTS